MFTATLAHLVCPRCRSPLALVGDARPGAPLDAARDVEWGEAKCRSCDERYPILAGVLILVADVGSYLAEHAKGLSRHVPDERVPKTHRSDFVEARKQLEDEHIDEDLESERVTALYLMTHYLKAKNLVTPAPEIADLVSRHWDNGPFSRIARALDGRSVALVELGCGVGGLLPALGRRLTSYLGVDSSFASIVLARRIALGAGPKPFTTGVPDDLLLGPLSRLTSLPQAPQAPARADFVVGDVEAPALAPARWQACAALNVIDMMNEPGELPRLQSELLDEGGIAIASSPYIWHPTVAAELRATLGKAATDSAAAVRTLYENAGFALEVDERHVPWVFFKNARQVELYSVHLLIGRKERS